MAGVDREGRLVTFGLRTEGPQEGMHCTSGYDVEEIYCDIVYVYFIVTVGGI